MPATWTQRRAEAGGAAQQAGLRSDVARNIEADVKPMAGAV
jgi:hypothetical protein